MREIRQSGSEGGEVMSLPDPYQEVFRSIGRLSQSELTVLITGETGCGKELVARALHAHSPRRGAAFIALNTAAIAPELLESELFGHEQGAFTGALKRHIGRFEQAQGGTLFLDEIGDMPAALQTRLLRVLAEGEFYRVGGRTLIRADVRILAATHQDLGRAVHEGRFRADLLHRLDVVRIQLPPLRDRRADIPALAEFFLAEAATELKLPPKHLTPDALSRLQTHGWSGNIRELRNLCQRLTVLSTGAQIDARDVAAEFSPAPAAPIASASNAWTDALRDTLQQRLQSQQLVTLSELTDSLETIAMAVALEHTAGDRQAAAKLLGCGRNTLTRKLGPKR